MHKTLIALTFGLLSSVVAAEQMYRWVDDQGVPQFGQQPPEGKAYQRMDISSPPPPGGTLRAPAPLAQNEDDQAQTEEDPTTTDAALAAKRTEQCAKIRSNLQTMERNPRLSKTTDDGQTMRIGEDERQEMMDQARADLEEFCS
ncbi:DUF4124 domain-containing protein [uncultured Halopseudomonas sp.]|uniref:DUF4124 domain-containing protein n=1 Tax=uncultured Halopseudomonas sp. TaxID=2901193 RepID=UPI0030EB41D0|tara:strand:+ start:4775 stop:5206 length:432 start_codon:yes stop_codon:yes gene_type:complete